jgi:hypothetical protein
MIIWTVLAGLYALHLLLKLNWIATAVIGVFIFLRLPHHKKLYAKQQEQLKRFRDVSEYMDTLLYSFLREEKVEAAVSDTEATMMDGPMRELVGEALDHMRMTFDNSDVMRDALRHIDEEYNCRRLRNIHDFMVHVEEFGGVIKKPVDLLLEDKSRWEKRIGFTRAERGKMFTDIVLSVIVSLIICAIIIYIPVADLEVSDSAVSQILTVVVVVLDDLIITRGQKYLAEDWLSLDMDSGEYEEKRLREFYSYNEKKERRLSTVLCVITGIATAVCFFFGKRVYGAAGLLLMVVMANQHKIGRSLSRKNMIKYVKCAFPVWLMDMILLLQSENVQVALMKSMDQAPAVLRPDLELINDRLMLAPESAEPYHAFMQEFQIPEVHAAMSMLFSLSIGNSGQADRQLSELILQNLEMLDVVEKDRLHDKSSGMYMLFLAPILTGSLKLLVDMAIFMITFLANAGTV